MSNIIKQYQYNTAAGPFFKPGDQLGADFVESATVKYIAYYLPQFHAIPENDEWWGKGFTEWTNVSKALPRFSGHYQPRLPSDLGFYNLTSTDVLKAQVDLAKRGGIYGFCIHNYWFGGKTLLDRPLTLLLENKSIDFKFCLNWANESWSRRWDGLENEMLIEQKYSNDTLVRYAEYLMPFLNDSRYITVGGRPLIMLYRPGNIPSTLAAIEMFRNALIKKGMPDPFLIMPQAFSHDDPREFGFDAAAGFPPHSSGWSAKNKRWRHFPYEVGYKGTVVSYQDVAANALAKMTKDYILFPGVFPAWDNEARKPNRGFTVAGSSPTRYGQWLEAASYQVLSQENAEPFVFINAWNEWAEGAYLEPDRHYGYAYLIETRDVLERIISAPNGQAAIIKRDSLKSNIISVIKSAFIRS